MFNQARQNSRIVAGNLSQALKALRSALAGAGNVCGSVVAQTPADLAAIGFDAADVTQIQAVWGSLVTLIEMANGGPPPTATGNYVEQSIDLIGPQPWAGRHAPQVPLAQAGRAA
jgi:hypothetical protein